MAATIPRLPSAPRHRASTGATALLAWLLVALLAAPGLEELLAGLIPLPQLPDGTGVAVP
jgi:hypothetical protein